MEIAIGVVLILVFIYTITVYNNLVFVKNNVEKAWANIDVLLKQRHDELPKLVDTCKHYMKHEQATLEKVIAARNQVANAQSTHEMAELGKAETQLRSGLGQLFALAESYPELKADGQFVFLQNRITALENSIADRREFYNESVNINNVRVAEFPSNIVAILFGFFEAELLKFTEEELKDVDISKQFSA
jgi:LemA protein